MNVQRFEDASAFYEQVEPYLMQDEAAHNLILGICSSLLGANPYKTPPYLAMCEHEGSVVGVALRTPPHHLILSKMAREGAVDAFAQDVYALYGELSGTVSLKAEVTAFARCWQAISGQIPQLRRKERSYRLDKVNPVHGVSGEYCPPSEDDFETMVQWYMHFAAEATESVPREEAEQAVRWRMDSDPKIRGMRLWKDNGKPVSMAGYGGLTPNSIRLGPIYTPSADRQRGYASALTAAVSQEMLDHGRKFVTLFTDLSNPTSNHIYQMVGFQPVYDVDEYHFEETVHE